MTPPPLTSLLRVMLPLAGSLGLLGTGIPPAASADPGTVVYLDDSLEALDRLNDVQRLAARGAWTSAAEMLDTLITEHGQRLTPDGSDRYITVTRRSHAVLAGWPSEGLAAYRRMVDESAHQALIDGQRHKHLPTVLLAADRYLFSTHGFGLVDLAGQLALLEGDTATARDAYARFAADVSLSADERRRLSARLSLVAAVAGDLAKARQIAASLRGGGSEVAVTWQGGVQPLDDVLGVIAASMQPITSPTVETHWPTIGGDNQRNRHPALSLDALALLWQHAAHGNDPRDRSDAGNDLRAGRTAPQDRHELQPVVAAHRIVAQDARRVWALDAVTGRTLWTHTHALKIDPRLLNDMQNRGLHAPTIAHQRVYALLGEEPVTLHGGMTQDQRPVLVCLALESGRPLWSWQAPLDERGLGERTYDPSPLVVGNRLLIIERVRRSFGFEDAFLMGFDALTGALQFRTHLGAATVGSFGYRRTTLAVPAADDAYVYVATSLGTIAAVSVHHGQVSWLVTYASIASNADRFGMDRVPFTRTSQVVLQEDGLIVLPTDANHVYVIRPADGQVEQVVPVAEIGEAAALLGVVDNTMYTVGSSVTAYDLVGRSVLWQHPLDGAWRPVAPGLLTREELLVPAAQALLSFDRVRGTVREAAFPEGTRGGILLVVGERLVVAEGRNLCAYGDQQRVRQRLAQRMAADPNDAEPALELAELALHARAIDEALDLLDDAWRRCHGCRATEDSAFRHRFFDTCLRLAATMMQAADSGSVPKERLDRLYAYAAQCPGDFNDHLRWRFAQAANLATLGDHTRAVELMQQVLFDASLRELAWHGPGEVARPAGEHARRTIDRWIKEHGEDIYAPFAERAAADAERAWVDRDVEKLVEISIAYPNASAADIAQVRAGQLLLQREEWHRAVRILHRALDSDNAIPMVHRAELMGWIGTGLARLGSPAQAADWFGRGRRLAPDAKITFAGRKMNWEELAAALGTPVPGSTGLARLAWPPAERFERMYPEPVTLLRPIADPGPRQARAIGYLHSDGEVQALDVLRDEIRWTSSQAYPLTPQIVDHLPDLVVLAGPHVITGVKRETGVERWRRGTFPPERLAADADHEDFPAYTRFVASARDLLALRSDGQLHAIELATGQLRWSYATGDPTASIACGPRLCALALVTRGEPALQVLAAQTGETVCRVSMPESAAVERLLLTADETLIAITTHQVLAFDARSGRPRWQATDDPPISPAGAILEMDGLYYLAEGNRVVRLSLGTGRALWRSPAVSLGVSAVVRLDVSGDDVLVAGDSFAMVLDRECGALLAVPGLPAGVQIGQTALTETYWLLFDVQTFDENQPLVLHAFRYRDALGPLDGEQIPLLSNVTDLSQIQVYDQAILTVKGRRLTGHVASVP